MKNFVLIIISLSVLGINYSQDFNQYQPMKSKGMIPEDFTKLSSEKYKSDIDKHENDSLKIRKRVANDFYLESNFAIGDILSNGRILFNEPLSNYLEEIFQKIKLANPILQNQNIRFYISSSTIVNAFTTQEGIILFNTGLLAKLTTEDEIAYVMCHEIAHFLEKHNLKQFSFNSEVDRDKGTYKSENWETALFAKANYSQNHEMEADSIGLTLFQNTNYNFKSALSALESLKTYFLPFESEVTFNPILIGFNTTLFELPELTFPTLDLDKIYSSKNNKFSTHPDMEDRINSVNSNLINRDRTPTPNAVRTIAQFELCHLFLERAMYSHVIYVALALQRDYPESQYLKEVILKSIYGFSQAKSSAKIKSGGNLSKLVNQNDNNYLTTSPPEIKHIDQFLSDLDSKKLNVLAIFAFWDYLTNNKPLNKQITEERMRGLIQSHKSLYSSDLENTEIMKLVNTNINFAALYNAVEAIDDRIIKFDNDDGKTDNFGIDNLIVLSPEYRKFNLTKEKAYRYLASEKLLGSYHDAILDNSESLNMQTNILSNSFIQTDEVKAYNDIALLYSFLSEKLYSSSNSIFSRKEELIDLIDRYGTDKIALLGVYSVQFPKAKAERVAVLVWTAVVFPLFPLGLYHAVTPKFRTFNYTLLIDLSNEALLYSNIHQFKMKGNNAVVRSSLYNQLLIINNGNHD